MRLPNWFYNKHNFDQSSEEAQDEDYESQSKRDETCSQGPDISQAGGGPDPQFHTVIADASAEEIQPHKPKRVQKNIVIRSKSKSNTKTLTPNTDTDGGKYQSKSSLNNALKNVR